MSNSVREHNDGEGRKIIAARNQPYERQIAQQQQAIDSATTVMPQLRSGMSAGNAPTLTLRQQAELRQEAAAPEQKLIPPPQRTSAATTGVNDGGNVAFKRTRDRQEIEQAQAQVERGEQPTSSIADYYADLHKAEQQQAQQREEERQQRQARINAANEARLKFNQRMFPVKLMLQEREANEVETKKIWDIAVAHPEYSVDQLYATLLELRRLTAFKSDWKLPEVRRKR